MDKYFEQLNQTFKSNSFDEITNMHKEQQLLCLYGFYNFYHADTGNIMELISSSVALYDENSKDHIDGIFIDDDADEATVEMVSSYYVYPGMDFLTFDKLEEYYSNMYNAAFEALHKSSTTRAKLIHFFEQDDDYHFGEGKKKVCLNIITNLMPKSDVKRKYVNKVAKLNVAKDVICKITFGQDIEQAVLEIESPKEYVDHGFLLLDKPDNYLKFGPENSIIINISAKSLKSIYEQYYNQGLFAQNLRYYVKSAKTDNKIIESIKNKGDKFWYFNNGIIIICDKFKMTGSTILLEKFSIINGGQTTKLIGDTEFEDDFYIQCKIIRNKYTNEKEKSQFIADVAEATNTQKPIKEKDLVANRVEQRELKSKMAAVGVYVQIKRGAVISKKVYPEPWQNTTNEELGQLLYSFMYQYPGAARNNKASITGNEERYKLIFAKDYNEYMLRDLCHFKAFYKKWLKLAKDKNYYDDPYMGGLLKNGMFFFAAAIGVMSKLFFNNYITQFKTIESMGEKYNLLSQYDINHPILINNIDLYANDFYSLLHFIYKKYIKDGYIDAKEDDPNIIYSNFMKTDKNYKRYIMRNIIKNFDEQDIKQIKNLFHTVNDAEKEKNNDLLKEYFIEYNNINISYDELDIDEKEIFDKFKSYRTTTYKFKKIKAYDVFRDKDIIAFIKKKPKSIVELSDLNCLKNKQLEDYGEDIIAILNGTFNRFKID